MSDDVISVDSSNPRSPETISSLSMSAAGIGYAAPAIIDLTANDPPSPSPTMEYVESTPRRSSASASVSANAGSARSFGQNNEQDIARAAAAWELELAQEIAERARRDTAAQPGEDAGPVHLQHSRPTGMASAPYESVQARGGHGHGHDRDRRSGTANVQHEQRDIGDTSRVPLPTREQDSGRGILDFIFGNPTSGTYRTRAMSPSRAPIPPVHGDQGHVRSSWAWTSSTRSPR